MPQITFRLPSGTNKTVTASSGASLMEEAKNADIPGMVAECGGTLSCATCHVYIADEWIDKVPAAGADELDLLDVVPDPRVGSRLSCQIQITEMLDGLLVDMPEAQY